MRLPSKVTSFKQSIIPRFVAALDVLKKNPMTPSELFAKIGDSVNGLGDFVEILDCLYALRVIDFDCESELLRYVD